MRGAAAGRSKVLQPVAAARDGVLFRVVELELAVALHVDVVGCAVGQAADIRSAAIVIDRRVAAAQPGLAGIDRVLDGVHLAGRIEFEAAVGLRRLDIQSAGAEGRGADVREVRRLRIVHRNRCADSGAAGAAAAERLRAAGYRSRGQVDRVDVVVRVVGAVVQLELPRIASRLPDVIIGVVGEPAHRGSTLAEIGYLVAGLQAARGAEVDRIVGGIDLRGRIELHLPDDRGAFGHRRAVDVGRRLDAEGSRRRDLAPVADVGLGAREFYVHRHCARDAHRAV